MGTIPAPNLTSGKGGIATSYTDTDWVRAIRHGVMPEGRGEVLMFDYSTMSDQNLGDLIAYLKQIPPVDTNYPEMRYGPLVPIVSEVGLLPLAQNKSITVRRAQQIQCRASQSNTADIFLQFAPPAMVTALATW